VNIREIQISDAAGFSELCLQLEKETSFMLYEPGESGKDVEQLMKEIEGIKKDALKELFVIEDNEKLVGYLAVSGQNINRIKHRAFVVIGILREYNGKGLGKRLFGEAELWARKNDVKRLECSVATNNKRALWFFSTLGFNVEGIRRKALIVDGMVADEFYMSKML